MIKKLLALFLALILCLSLVACGGETPNTDGNKPQTNENTGNNSQQENTENTNTNEIDWQVQLCATEWYCVGSKMPIGMIFNADGTVGASTWEFTDNKVVLTLPDGETITYEIRTINNIHFLVGLTDGISYYQGQHGIDWSSLPITAIEITIENWQDYIEVVNVANDNDNQYHLKLKNTYRQAVVVDVRDDCDSWFSVCYSQGEEKSVSREITFQWDTDYIVVKNPAEVPLEIEKIEGTLYIIDGLL